MRVYVVPYIGTWIETIASPAALVVMRVVPYIGTWIETFTVNNRRAHPKVVPYIGTWIETRCCLCENACGKSYLI